MAALYLHNSIWVPDATESPRGASPHPHARTTSNATIQTLPISDLSHPTQPLLHSSTSESVAYMDLLSRQPNHPTHPRGSAMELSFDGDPTTVRERKGYFEKVVRRRLRRLKAGIAVLEVIIAAWSIYTTVRYFLAFAIYPSNSNGEMATLALATLSLVSFALLFAAGVLQYLQTYLIGHNITIKALLNIRTTLRYSAAVLVLVPALVNFILVFVWRTSSDSALNMGNRCDLDIDVVWSIRSHSTCTPPAWGAWLALAIVRLLITAAILVTYHLTLTSYQHTRRPSLHHHASTFSESTYFGSPPMSVTPLPSATIHDHHHQQQPSSSSTLNSSSSNSYTRHPERRSLRSSRASSLNRQHSNSPPNSKGDVRLPRSRSNESPRSSSEEEEEEFDPYANLTPGPATTQQPIQPSESDRELYSFVDRFRSLVSQIHRESEEAAQLTPSSFSASIPQSSYAYPTFPPSPVVGYDEFGRPYPPDDHVRILNSYIRRMPTIESIGSREMSTAGTASVRGDRTSMHTLSRPPTRAMTDRDGGQSEPPSRQGSLSLAAVELVNAMGGVGVEGLPEVGIAGGGGAGMRRGSVGSSVGSISHSQSGTGGGSGSGTGTGSGSTAGTNVSGASYFTANPSPLQTPIVESPLEGPLSLSHSLTSTPQLPSLQPGTSSASPATPTTRSLPPLPRALMHTRIAEEELLEDSALPSPSPSLPPLPRALRPLPRPPFGRADSV
ncbi:hypothetical protein R3P38DRAFT_2847836 [Favolaschia claudopus]|uniref:Transmembrane protein n=1 Tax=Favolaschia claudopus TaxID=2862362 RepID=A0AAW0DXE2_9AGAR